MKIIDISRVIAENSVVYPGDDNLKHPPLCSIPDSPCNITTLLNWTTHFLTHVDPPLHFINGGKSLGDINLSRFCGGVLVVAIPDNCDEISLEHIHGIDFSGVNTIFFKTRNSKIATEDVFHENHVFLGKDAAERLGELRMNMIGIDYISIDKYGDETYPAHNALLKNEVIILEGLDLSSVDAGHYRFFAFPLSIKGADGSPVRAVLQTD